MSKNVAVFVDVANIFYAAKAAGADIDYVTLLKSAVAGRDFVRAYAYTGLDPENENQRQFHAFLARSGYKVVSKDIRKYGDGRIKANLDIELVVDMMRMARNLDIAVVVSGDGDFAPAIRAVQQMGVRVEVISFRGNTSSDLIEVADTFTDIAQIARVDKTSARSGRRVAAEGDLSMTEVPEKETEGAPRRRRGRAREERPQIAVAETSGMSGNLIVLPGERLSRSPGDEDGDVTGEPLAAAELEELPEAGEASTASTAEQEAEGRRRRRRRGGRGRGRGRRSDQEIVAGEPAESGVSGEPGESVISGELGESDDEQEQLEELLPSQAPHHTFGSVWDSQLGMPSKLVAIGGEPAEDEQDLEEPEIPEYLLAERRQRGPAGQPGQRGRGGAGRTGRGRNATYQAALERERFGRGGSTGGFGAPRAAERPARPDRGRGGRGPDRGRGERPVRPPRGESAPSPARSSGDPWSEVPPELEEMLRAEVARKTAQPPPPVTAEVTPAEAPTRRAPRRRPAGPTETPATAEAPTDTDAKPAARRRTTKATAASAEKPRRASRARAAATTPAEPAEPAADAEPAKPVRRRRTKAEIAAETANGE